MFKLLENASGKLTPPQPPPPPTPLHDLIIAQKSLFHHAKVIQYGNEIFQIVLSLNYKII